MLVLVSCAGQPAATPTVPQNPQAADFRVRLDLLLGETTMIILKESEAAANHSDAYSAYLSLLTANSADVANVLRLAFGNTTADDFARRWNSQNANFVDYAIGMVTHDQDKANAALSRLTGDSTPKLENFLVSLLHVPTRSVGDPLNYEVSGVTGAIDQAVAPSYLVMYGDIHNAFAWATQLGDLISQSIVRSFPDKFPGEFGSDPVTRRVLTNELLEERAYLLTMDTDALINGRSAEQQQAVTALSQNAGRIGRMQDVWKQQVSDIEAYASHADPGSLQGIMQDFVNQLSTRAGVPPGVVSDQAGATVKVVDDQRTKSFKLLATHDRGAAVAMQAVADAIAASGQG